MATTVDMELELAVREALAWAKFHPGRDVLDCATAAVMNVPIAPGSFQGQHDQFGKERWTEFLAAVKEAMERLHLVHS